MIQHRILVTSVETGSVSRIFHLLSDVFLHVSQGSFILHHGNPQPAFLGVITYNQYIGSLKPSFFMGLGPRAISISLSLFPLSFSRCIVRPDRVKIYAVGCL